MLRDELVAEIGKTLLREANRQSSDWEYVGYSFASLDGVNYEASGFVFVDRRLQDFTIRKVRRALGALLLRFREITRVDGDDYWLASNSVLRRTDKKFKTLFEFDDINRWKISPANSDRSYEILVGDVFPEALEEI